MKGGTSVEVTAQVNGLHRNKAIRAKAGMSDFQIVGHVWPVEP